MSQSVLHRTSLSPQELCRGLGLPYRSYSRWTRRREQGLPVLLPTGPRKQGPLPMDALIEELQSLVRRAKRTRGTGPLHQRWRLQIARRPLQSIVNEQRRDRLRPSAEDFSAFAGSIPTPPGPSTPPSIPRTHKAVASFMSWSRTWPPPSSSNRS